MSAPLGPLPQPAVFWHLDTYPTMPPRRRQGRAAPWWRPWGTCGYHHRRGRVAAAGWCGRGGSRPHSGEGGEPYTAQYMEGISNPGDVTPKHRHPGPEA